MSTLPVSSPWHAGELAIQQRAGVVERMAQVGLRNIRDYLPEQHREFFAQLPFIVLGTVDEAGEAWATVRAGRPGFVHSPDPHALQMHFPDDKTDPAMPGLQAGRSLAMLGIELHTRRRNRMNGTIVRAAAGQFTVAVAQSFGNCPQYIQRRAVAFVRDPEETGSVAPVMGTQLDQRAREIIANAATFFVASYADNPAGRQVDVSHRGGNPGFVRVDADGGLTIPDFAGNLFFNTLGNLLLNGRAGLVFVDFASGALLQMTGDAQVILDSPEIAAFKGAERLWHFTPRRVVYRADALPVRWEDDAEGASPNSLMTGNWNDAALSVKAAGLSKNWRSLRVARIVDESTLVRSFHLASADDAGLIPHAAGQHLPIRVMIDAMPVIRSYTLSVAPSDGMYRISVKREGRVSAHLHDTLSVGDLLETRAPAGGFRIDALERRPAVLLAAGIGITPMLAMLRHTVYEGIRKRRVRPTWMFYSAKSLPERAFSGELQELAAKAQGEVTIVRALSDTSGATKDLDFDVSGRIDMDLLRARLPFDDYDFYLCGPSAFMQSMYDGLRALNVADNRIHAESFGPSSLVRSAPDLASAPKAAPATTTVPVTFVTSAKEARWTPEGGTLLELAEQRGLAPDFGCRSGSCGTCRTRVLKGEVTYPSPISFDAASNEALICCAVPAEGTEPVVLDL